MLTSMLALAAAAMVGRRLHRWWIVKSNGGGTLMAMTTLLSLGHVVARDVFFRPLKKACEKHSECRHRRNNMRLARLLKKSWKKHF